MRASVVRFAMLMLAAGGTITTAPLAGAAEPAAKSSRDDPDKVICRRESVTGSLAQSRKVCMTRREWAERSRGAQETGQRMQEAGLINPCGSSTPGAC